MDPGVLKAAIELEKARAAILFDAVKYGVMDAIRCVFSKKPGAGT